MSTDNIVYVYHPHELALKGKNRPQFEKALSSAMRVQMKDAGVQNLKIDQIHGRHFATAPAEYESIVAEVSPKVFGVANYAKCYVVERDIEKLKESVVEHFRLMKEKGEVKDFKIETSRVDKRYPTNSMEVSKIVGAAVHDTLDIPVNVHTPSVMLRIEILNDKFLYFSDRHPGALGLPIASSGKFMCLLSGGFDSPVAVWMMMRRGCQVSLVHFHSQPYGEWRSSISKVRTIVQQLAKWGGPKKFYSVPIGESQRQIAVDAPPKLRVTLYRRLMVRIAKALAEKEKCLALATGDSLGQVASQTIESMTTIQSTIAPMLIMRPLLGFAKEEIIDRADKIGTKDLSLLPGGDCCSHMLPKKVATKPTIEEATDGEKKLDTAAMVEAALAAAQIIDINDPWNEEDNEVGDACPLEFQE